MLTTDDVFYPSLENTRYSGSLGVLSCANHCAKTFTRVHRVNVYKGWWWPSDTACSPISQVGKLKPSELAYLSQVMGLGSEQSWQELLWNYGHQRPGECLPGPTLLSSQAFSTCRVPSLLGSFPFSCDGSFSNDNQRCASRKLIVSPPPLQLPVPPAIHWSGAPCLPAFSTPACSSRVVLGLRSSQ